MKIWKLKGDKNGRDQSASNYIFGGLVLSAVNITIDQSRERERRNTKWKRIRNILLCSEITRRQMTKPCREHVCLMFHSLSRSCFVARNSWRCDRYKRCLSILCKSDNSYRSVFSVSQILKRDVTFLLSFKGLPWLNRDSTDISLNI